MKYPTLHRGLAVCVALAAVLVAMVAYLGLRGAPADAHPHAALATHPAETLSFATVTGLSTTFYLASSNSTNGFGGDATFVYGRQYMVGIAGDWTGKGYDSVGVVDYPPGVFYLRNSNTAGNADIAFAYGPGNCLPLAGDWTGKGYDSIGVYCVGTGIFYLRNSNTPGPADIAFAYGPPASGCSPVVGDWTGKGYDSVGVFCNGVAYLRNSNTAGNADIAFAFGPTWNSAAVGGDWTGQGFDTLAVECGIGGGRSAWCLRNSNTAGNADTLFTVPVYTNLSLLAGHWTPPS